MDTRQERADAGFTAADRGSMSAADYERVAVQRLALIDTVFMRCCFDKPLRECSPYERECRREYDELMRAQSRDEFLGGV